MATLGLGSTFAGYRIEDVAGQGGMGIVYRASQLALDRPVALKLIAAEMADDVDFRARFIHESKLAASIDHPNIIPVYEAGEAEGRLFIAMRYVEGTDLRWLIQHHGMIEPARAVRIVGQVAAALDAAHRRDLVHRDVKPANVLLAQNGEEHAYLSDFGLTKRTTSVGGLTKTGQFLGTVDYVAPEQIQGYPTDARADIYALGCVLFHSLTGRAPFARGSEVAVIYAHLEEPPPAASAEAPGVGPGLDEVIARAMAKKPDDRYASAGDLARAAAAALDGAATDAHGRSTATGTESGAVLARRRATGAVRRGASTRRATGAVRRGASTSPGTQAPAGRRFGALGIGLAALLAIGIVATALAAGGILGGGDDGGAAEDVARPRAETRAPPAPVASIPVGDGPDGITVAGSDVWVTNAQADTLTRVDARTNEIVGEPLRLGDDPDGVAAGSGVLWVANTGDDEVTRVEARGAPVRGGSVAVGAAPEAISLGKQLVWVANSRDGTVNRIDRASSQLVGGPIGVGSGPVGIFVGENTTWVTNTGDDTVTRIDTSTAEVQGQPIGVGRRPRGVVEGLGAIWVANSGSDTVSRLDPRSGSPVGDPIRVGDNPREIAVGEGLVWVTNNDGNSVSVIDPKLGRVRGQPIPVGSGPIGIAVGAGGVWVANHAGDTVTRLRP